MIAVPARMYSVPFDNIAIAAGDTDVELVEVIPATNKPIVLVSFRLRQTTRQGDAQEEMLRWSIVRGNTTAAASALSGGGAVTPVPLAAADTAAGFTSNIFMGTTASTAGTTIEGDDFNVRIGIDYYPIPEERILCTAAQSRLCIRLLETVSATMNFSGVAKVAEIG